MVLSFRAKESPTFPRTWPKARIVVFIFFIICWFTKFDSIQFTAHLHAHATCFYQTQKFPIRFLSPTLAISFLPVYSAVLKTKSSIKAFCWVSRKILYDTEEEIANLARLPIHVNKLIIISFLSLFTFFISKTTTNVTRCKSQNISNWLARILIRRRLWQIFRVACTARLTARISSTTLNHSWREFRKRTSTFGARNVINFRVIF